MRYNIIFIATVFSILFNHKSNGQIRKYSNEFLNIGVGARGLAMGGSVLATTQDVNAIYWNPAGLAACPNFQIGGMHSEYFAGLAKYDYAAVALPLPSERFTRSYFGLALTRFAVDNIPNTLQLIEPNGNINYDKVSTFSTADYALMGTYACEILHEEDAYKSRSLKVGGNVKVIRRVVGTFAGAWGFGLDAGALYKNNNIRIGVALKDITTTFNIWSFHFNEDAQRVLALTGNEIPKTSSEITLPSIRGGMAYIWSSKNNKFGLAPEIALTITTDGKRNVLLPAKPFSIDASFGAEADYKQIVYLRAGISNIQRYTSDIGKRVVTVQPNAGIGLNFKTITIDYALTNLGNLSSVLYSHVFSLKLNMKKSR
jgi:hypothetical protein